MFKGSSRYVTAFFIYIFYTFNRILNKRTLYERINVKG
jgi:hypothetical protein